MSEDRYSRRARRRERPVEGASNHERWLISYADLATLLFALFVVLYAVADHDRARAVAEAIAMQMGERGAPVGRSVLTGGDALLAAQASIDRAFAANDALRSRASVATTERGLIVSLAEAGFFAPGEAKVRDDALPLIDALADALNAGSAPVRIEGHTDSTPISTERYPSNWELSSARAAAVLARLTARGIRQERLSVAGYADARPIADNSTPEGRARNRRVDIVVLRAND
jgi:chemotaxis protein MotB